MRLTRMARLAKLLRAIPEITVLLNGMAVATRTVACTISLMFCIVYVFAIAFVNLCGDGPLAEKYFQDVSSSIHTLLIAGAFPDLEELMRDIAAENMLIWIVMVVFVLLATITVMNMLIGVLVEVVKVSSQVERDALDVKFVRSTIMTEIIRAGMAESDDPLHVWLTRDDFVTLLQVPNASKSLQGVGIDVVGLIDVLDYIFKEDAPLSFPDLMEIVLQLRSSTTTTVRDIVDLRKYITHEVNKLIKILESAETKKSVEAGWNNTVVQYSAVRPTAKQSAWDVEKSACVGLVSDVL